jgi:hypothetical protein
VARVVTARWTLRQFALILTYPGVVIASVYLVVKLFRSVCRWLVFPGSTMYVTSQIDTELALRVRRRIETCARQSARLIKVRATASRGCCVCPSHSHLQLRVACRVCSRHRGRRMSCSCTRLVLAVSVGVAIDVAMLTSAVDDAGAGGRCVVDRTYGRVDRRARLDEEGAWLARVYSSLLHCARETPRCCGNCRRVICTPWASWCSWYCLAPAHRCIRCCKRTRASVSCAGHDIVLTSAPSLYPSLSLSCPFPVPFLSLSCPFPVPTLSWPAAPQYGRCCAWSRRPPATLRRWRRCCRVRCRMSRVRVCLATVVPGLVVYCCSRLSDCRIAVLLLCR